MILRFPDISMLYNQIWQYLIANLEIWTPIQFTATNTFGHEFLLDGLSDKQRYTEQNAVKVTYYNDTKNNA